MAIRKSIEEKIQIQGTKNEIFLKIEEALKNAQEEGLKFNQYRNGEEVKRAFTQLTDGEKETFKIGVKDYLMDKVAK